MKSSWAGKIVLVLVCGVVLFGGLCRGVTTKITRQSTAADLEAGQTEDVIIDSTGTIRLARQAETLDLGGVLEDAWIINELVIAADGTVYIGTSPNGDIIRYHKGKATKIYPAGQENSADSEKLFTNRHIFAMALDSAGRLLAAVSGDGCRLLRFNNLAAGDIEPETIFEPERALYIFDIAVDQTGGIYLATGPEGRIYATNPFGKNPKLIYDAPDNNFLSLAIGKDGFIYAGTDERGLIYKIDPAAQEGVVLYDSDQLEITALLLDDEGNLYAAATSAKAGQEKEAFAGMGTRITAGRPDTKKEPKEPEKPKKPEKESSTLSVANTSDAGDEAKEAAAAQAARGSLPKEAGHIYRIDSNSHYSLLLKSSNCNTIIYL